MERPSLAANRRAMLKGAAFAVGGIAIPTLSNEAVASTASESLQKKGREVVAAGASVAASGPLVAAAREAMLNAARHAGGTVSVYLESSDGAIDVFVRDRGPGVDLAALPADRLGIRESIIGRMTRAGGTGTVRATETGTEVHLHLEAAP